jgi:hypothetical protein
VKAALPDKEISVNKQDELFDNFTSPQFTARMMDRLSGLWTIRDGILTSARDLDGFQLIMRKKNALRVGEQGYSIKANIDLLEWDTAGFMVFGFQNENSYWTTGLIMRDNQLIAFLGRRVNRAGDGSKHVIEASTPPGAISDEDATFPIAVELNVSDDPVECRRRLEVNFNSTDGKLVADILQFTKEELNGRIGFGSRGGVAFDNWRVRRQAFMTAPDVILG